MMAARANVILAFVAFLLSVSVQALYEDEIGQYDWVLTQIGKPTALAYSGDSPDHIFASSASGVVASMSLKDGKLRWRRVAVTGGSVQLLRPAGRGLMSITDTGLVQAWKNSNGDLSWQREYSNRVVELLAPGTAAEQTVVVVTESEIEDRTLAGKHEWSVAASKVAAKSRFWAAVTSEGDANVCGLAALADGSGAKAVKIEVKSGKVLSQDSLPADVAKGLKSGAFMVVDSFLVAIIDGKVQAYSLCEAKDKFEAVDLSKVKSTGSGAWRLQPWQRTRGVFAVTNGASTVILSLSKKALKQLRTLDGAAVVGPVFSVENDETGQPVALAVVKEEGTQIQLMDPASGNVQPAANVGGFSAADHGEGRLLLVREMGSGEHRTVISAADHSLAGIQAGKVDWIREESLASVRHADFFTRQSAEPRRVEDISLIAQLSQLPVHVAELLKAPLDMVSYFTRLLMTKASAQKTGLGIMPDAKVPTAYEELRDFGANKLILAVTGAPKLFALEATTSEIIWQKYLGPMDPDCIKTTRSNTSSLDRCTPWMKLLPSSAAAYSELVVMPPEATAGAARQVLWVDPLNGKVLHQESLPKGVDVASVMPLPSKPDDKIKPVLVVDSKQGLHALPKKNTELELGNLFHYEVDSAAQLVQGFSIGKDESGKPKSLVPLWNMEVGSVGERILAASTPAHREWDHVPVHIKGDASILYKYINPNLLTLATESSKGYLTVYALDAVTGHIVHQSQIPGATGPVSIAACDNWIVVHYRNAEQTRFEVLITELFQAKSDEGPWDILFPGKQAVHTKSAHHLEMPVPLSQTYIFPAGVTAMGVTATLKGITPRSIIMALTTDQIFRVSKEVLNPRRPYPPTGGVEDKTIPKQFAPTKEEILMPYGSVLPFRHTDIMNYGSGIGQVEGIISSPTALESTSLVLTYGLDLFFMPVQTAKAYDVLSPGFNYLLLYGSVGVVVAVFVVTTIWAKHEALKDKWK